MVSESRPRQPALECGDSSPLSAGDWSPSNVGARPLVSAAVPPFAARLPRRAAWPTSRPGGQSGDQSPHSINAPRAAACGPRPLECGDSSPLSAGDSSPSNVEARPLASAAVPPFAARLPRRAAWPTSRPGGQSGDQSPHSISALRALACGPRSLECGDSSPLSAGDWSPSNVGARPLVSAAAPSFTARLPRRAAWPTSRPGGQSGDKSPHSISALRASARGPRPLECGDSSPLSAGDLSPSNVGARPLVSAAVPPSAARLPRRAAWPTSRPGGQSGDKSPHSIIAPRAAARGPRPLECGDSSPLSAGDLSPSNVGARPLVSAAVPSFAARLPRRAAWPTSRPGGQSGDKSPHSKFAP